MAALWRPESEAEAVSLRAVFVEWLRASGRRPDASPLDLRQWWMQDEPALRQAARAFSAPDEVPLADLLAPPPQAADLLAPP